MKKVLLLSLVSLSFVFPGSIPSALAESAKAVSPKKNLALHEVLIAKEKSVWDAYKQKDAKALGQLLAEDYYAIEDADGEIMSKAHAIHSVRNLELKNTK